MSQNIVQIAQFDLQEGKLEEFKRLFSIGIEDIKQKEPGTLSFNLYASPDEKTVCSIETYKDSQALLSHFEISSERISKILEICSVKSVEIYGPASKEVHDLLGQYGTVFYNFSVGYSK